MKRKIKRNRTIRSGIDYDKLAKIWNVLAEAGDWIHVAEISRRSKIHEATVRWYLDHYFKGVIEEARIVPTIRLRMVKLKPNAKFDSLVKALELIKEVKKSK